MPEPEATPGGSAAGDSDFPLLAATGARAVLAARAAALRTAAGAASAAGKGAIDAPPPLPRSIPRLPPRLLRLLEENGAAPLLMPPLAASVVTSASGALAGGAADAAVEAAESRCPIAVSLGADPGIDAEDAMLCVSAAADESVLARIKGGRQGADGGRAVAGAGPSARAPTADAPDAVVPFRCLRLLVDVTLRPPALETFATADATADAATDAEKSSAAASAPSASALEAAASVSCMESLGGPIPVAFGSFTKTWVAGTATTRRLAEAGCAAAVEMQRRQCHDGSHGDAESAVSLVPPPEANFDGVAEATAAAASAALEQLRAQLPGFLVSVRHQQLRLLREAFLPSIAAELAAVVRTAQQHAADAEAEVAEAELTLATAGESDASGAAAAQPNAAAGSRFAFAQEFESAGLLSDSDSDSGGVGNAPGPGLGRRGADSGDDAKLALFAAARRTFAASCLRAAKDHVGLTALAAADAAVGLVDTSSASATDDSEVHRLRCLLERQLNMVVDSALAMEAEAEAETLAEGEGRCAAEAGAAARKEAEAAATAQGTIPDAASGRSSDAPSQATATGAWAAGPGAAKIKPTGASTSNATRDSLRHGPQASESSRDDADSCGSELACGAAGGGPTRSRSGTHAMAAAAAQLEPEADPFAAAALQARQQRRLLELQEAQSSFRAKVKEAGGTLGLPVPQRRRRQRTNRGAVPHAAVPTSRIAAALTDRGIDDNDGDDEDEEDRDAGDGPASESRITAAGAGVGARQTLLFGAPSGSSAAASGFRTSSGGAAHAPRQRSSDDSAAFVPYDDADDDDDDDDDFDRDNGHRDDARDDNEWGGGLRRTDIAAASHQHDAFCHPGVDDGGEFAALRDLPVDDDDGDNDGHDGDDADEFGDVYHDDEDDDAGDDDDGGDDDRRHQRLGRAADPFAEHAQAAPVRLGQLEGAGFGRGAAVAFSQVAQPTRRPGPLLEWAGAANRGFGAPDAAAADPFALAQAAAPHASHKPARGGAAWSHE